MSGFELEDMVTWESSTGPVWAEVTAMFRTPAPPVANILVYRPSGGLRTLAPAYQVNDVPLSELKPTGFKARRVAVPHLPGEAP